LAATLPNLRPFLAYRASAPEDNSMGSNNQRRSRGRQGGKLKIAEVERLKTNLAAVKSLEEANCGLALQLLARVATRHKKLVFPSAAEKAEAATFWDHKKHLRLDIPMPDANVPVYLDHLLPTLLDLVQAAGGTDRKTRTAAAELLHAVVVIMIGQTAAHTEEMEARGPMTELFKRVLPALLDLAADADSVIQGLFRPLFSQLIHWFTKARKYETPETVCLLNCLLDAVCDSERDAARRQEAAAYLGEFAEWSVRQAAGGRTATGRHWRSILNRLYFLWRHPDPDKRSGACSAFAALYRRLREDEAVVGEHLLELLAAAMSGLRLAHADTEGSEAGQLARLSLDHIKRILFHYLSRQGCVPVLQKGPDPVLNSMLKCRTTFILTWLEKQTSLELIVRVRLDKID
jgi:DNA-dependent protein kinase catalytic subunit